MRVIYVDSYAASRSMMSAYLGMKFDSVVVQTAEQALNLMGQGDEFKAFIVANNNGKGLTFLTEVRRRHPLAVRVLMSGLRSREIVQAISDGDITRFVQNPSNLLQLLKNLEYDISLIPSILDS